MTGFCAPPTADQKKVTDAFKILKGLFDGEKVVEHYRGRKQKTAGNIIAETYGTSDTEFGAKMFSEIVYRATYKPALESFENFTEGDYRRISNEISKEANKLRTGGVGILEKLFFVKRGTMSKFAVTAWMNKHINLATNYERTQYSRYLKDHMLISKLLRTEVLQRGKDKPDGQSRWSPGIKAVRQLEKIERELMLVLNQPKTEESLKLAQKKYADINEILQEGGGKVLNEFRQYLETPITKGIIETPRGGTKTIETRWKKDESGKVIGKFSPLVQEAGNVARASLDSSGQVLINGLRNHVKVVKQSFLPDGKKSWSKVGQMVTNYENKIEEHIKAIEKGIDKGDYFPHYLLGTFIKVDQLMRDANSEKRGESYKGKETRDWSPENYLNQIDKVLGQARLNMGKPRAAEFRKGDEPYEDFMKNPLGVLRQYSMDAIAFNRVNYIKDIYLQGIKKLPKNAETSEGLRKYIDDIFTLAETGFQDRPRWVNRMVRAITGYEFFSKIGFGVATAARNTMSGLYYMQAVGNRSFLSYMSEYNKLPRHLQKSLTAIEKEQGFLFEDLSSELFTEGLLPTEGVNVRDVDIFVDRDGKPKLGWRDDKSWKAFDGALSIATGKAAILQKWTENYLRKHMFRHSFITKYRELERGGVSEGNRQKHAKQYALDIVNKYAFEYAAHQKSPFTGGTSHVAGSVGQVAAQFFHFPFSFLQMQSEVLRKSKDAAIARQWNSPDLLIPLRFAGLYAFTTLMSGVFNTDFHTLMENDTVDRILDMKAAVEGDEDIRGRGYMGPALGDLYFLATLHDFIELPDNAIKDLVVGYNEAYKMTDEQKHSRLMSTINVELSKWTTKQPKALQNGNIWNVMMNEFGLYPRAWTKDLRKKEPLKRIFPKQKRKKAKEAKKSKESQELLKLYRAMGI